MRARGGSLLLQFAGTALVWGSSFLFMKVGLDGLSPGQVAAWRIWLGAAALLIVCVVTRSALPRSPRTWAHLAVIGALLSVLPFLLFTWAEQHIDSSLASIYNATTPLMTTLVALAALPGERPGRTDIGGLLLGFIGVLVVMAPWRGVGDGAGTAQLACLGATLLYGAGFVYMRRFVTPLGIGAIPLATAQIGSGAVMMLLLAPWVAAGPMTLSWPVTLSMLALGVLGTGVAYVWNANVVAGWGATNASAVTYLTPVVGVALGFIALGERLSWNEPVGALIVIAGIALAQGRLRRPDSRATTGPTSAPERPSRRAE